MAEKRTAEKQRKNSVPNGPERAADTPAANGNGQQWMSGLRREALERFRAFDWPTPQDEEWRRTDISGFDLEEYEENPGGRTGAAAESGADGRKPMLSAPRVRAGRIVFSDSVCVETEVRGDLEERGIRLIPLPENPAGSSGSRLSDDIARDLQGLMRMGIEKADNKIAAWNASSWDTGVLLFVPRDFQADEPFWIDLEISGGRQLSLPHLFVYAAPGSRVNVIQRLVGKGGDESVCNAGIDVLVGENAWLDLVLVQEVARPSLFFSHGNARVERDGRFHLFEAHYGGHLVKSRFDAILAGRGADIYLRGLYFSGGDQHMDIRSVQHHLAPDTGSRSFYKGAVRDEARSVYQGLIEVGPEAARTDAYLNNKNLILNDGARADSIPSLRILTNDVKCSHGSTTGKVDKEQLFYLMTRGFSRDEAERMLITGFFDDLIKEAPTDLRDEIRDRVQARIAEPVVVPSAAE